MSGKLFDVSSIIFGLSQHWNKQHQQTVTKHLPIYWGTTRLPLIQPPELEPSIYLFSWECTYEKIKNIFWPNSFVFDFSNLRNKMSIKACSLKKQSQFLCLFLNLFLGCHLYETKLKRTENKNKKSYFSETRLVVVVKEHEIVFYFNTKLF